MSAAMAMQALTDFARETEEDLDADPRLADNPEALTYVLTAIRDCRADLAALYSKVEHMLLSVAGEKRFLVDGLGEVEIKKSTKRTQWDSEGLTRRLVAMALDERKLNEETGEFEPAWEAVGRVLSECARPAWRTTPLRARGLQIDEWCVEQPDGYRVSLPPRKVDE